MRVVVDLTADQDERMADIFNWLDAGLPPEQRGSWDDPIHAQSILMVALDQYHKSIFKKPEGR